MFNNYFKVALRNLIRFKAYAFINIVGLAIGLAGCLLIVGYVSNELSFENYHVNGDRIYRVQGFYNTGGASLATACAVPALGPALREELPEVESAVSIRRFSDEDIIIDDQIFENYSFLCAGPELLKIFTFPLITGDLETALAEPFSVLITEETAAKHFGAENPVGRSITVLDSLECRVAGVLQSIPPNTQFGCDFILSYASMEKIDDADTDYWQRLSTDYVYVLLRPGTDPASVEEKIPALFAAHLEPEFAARYDLYLQPFRDIYLRSDLSWELEPRGNLTYIYIFTSIAVLLLVIAGINFVVLATARTSHRMKEVGVRKVLGAQRSQLIGQFLAESIMLTAISMLLGMILFEIAQPQLEAFLGRKLAIGLFQSSTILLAIMTMTIAVGIFAGSYPALYISRFRPADVLKHGPFGETSNPFLRRALVIFQFTTAVALIFITLAIDRQIGFLNSKDLGFDKDNVIVLEIDDDRAVELSQVLRDEISKNCRVVSVAAMENPPGDNALSLTFVKSEFKPEDEAVMVQVAEVDYNYLDLFNIELVQGRAFDETITSDAEDAILINETAVKDFELTEPIGHVFHRRDRQLRVIGVVRDFHCSGLHHPIFPMIIDIDSDEFSMIAIRLFEDNGSETIAGIKDTWTRVIPQRPFEYAYLDDRIRLSYDDEAAIRSLFTVFSALAVFIACLGIFGLSSFTAERRSKEIGIRKVLGASATGIVRMLSREFLILVVSASVLAWPIAYYIVNRWLDEFPYRTGLGPDIYLISAFAALAFALLTAGYQAVRAALANPVDAIKYE